MLLDLGGGCLLADPITIGGSANPFGGIPEGGSCGGIEYS